MGLMCSRYVFPHRSSPFSDHRCAKEKQDYLNGSSTGEPTNGVLISNIRFIDIGGTENDDARDYYVLCGEGSCSNVSFENVHVAGGTNDSCNLPASGCPS